MTVHDDIESMIDVYLAGGLDDAERRDVEEHAASCDACARILRDAKEFHGWVKGSSAAGAPPTGLEDRIIANLRAATPGARRWPKMRGLKLLAGVAALFVFVIVGSLFGGSDYLAEVQNKLVARSGVEDHGPWRGVAQERGPGLVHRGNDLDGYAGDTTTEGQLTLGWGQEAAGYLGLPTRDMDKKYKGELERAKQGIANDEFYGASTLPGSQFSTTMGVGGGGGAGFRGRGPAGGRMDDSRLKNLDSDKASAPATAAPMEAGEESDREAFAAEKKSPESKLDDSLERKEQEQRPNAPPVVDDRKIIRNAELHLEVDKYDDAYKAIGEITRAKKGYISGATTTKLANGKIRATVVLRIPPEQFEVTLIELGKLGTPRHQAISTSDVTKQYQDLSSRLKSKETLVERLKKVLLEGKGTVKELMEVEVQMGATIEQIELIKGELKYYNDLVGMSTITMQVFEKDMGLPFEYVQTLQSVITVRALDADAKYAEAQKIILEAGGQVVQSNMARTNEESASGFVKGKVDAEKFPDVRKKLKDLGEYVDQDTVNQQQTGRGGQGDAKPGAPVKKEQAVIDFTVNTPPVVVTRQAAITIEVSPAESAYQQARQEVTAAGGEIVAGSLMDKTGGASAFVRARIPEGKFGALVEKLKSLGKVKNATVKQDEPGSETGRAPTLVKKGEIVIEIGSPPPLIPEESGIGRVLRDTFSRSVAGLLWSVEKLFVGIALAGPWIVLAIVVIVIWRRARRKAKPSAA